MAVDPAGNDRPGPLAQAAVRCPRPRVAVRSAGLIRPIAGEVECGDAFGVLRTDDAVTAVLCDGVYRSLVGRHAVTIHPSSVLYGKKVEAIVYNEFVFTTKSYARGVSAVQLDWVDEELCKDRGGI